MPAKKADGAAAASATSPATLQFTASETGLIVAIFKHSSKPSPDWEAVTSEIGAASAHSCQERFRSLCKKHNLQFSGSEASPRRKKKPSKNLDNIALPGDADGGGGDGGGGDASNGDETPSKKRKRNVVKQVPTMAGGDAIIRPAVKMEDDIVDGEF